LSAENIVGCSGAKSGREKPVLGAFSVMKAVAMLGMPFVHIIELYEYGGVLGTELAALRDIITGLTVFGPSIFMVCMGLGLSHKSPPRNIRKQGIQMLLINTGLNLIRFTIPELFLLAMGHIDPMDMVQHLLASDIYFFVGLFYILLSFVCERRCSSVKFFLFSLGMLGLNGLISGLRQPDLPLLSTLAGNIASVGYDSYFPLLGWCIYPCFGMLLKDTILCLDSGRRNAALGALLGLGAALTVTGAGLIRMDGQTVVSAMKEFALYASYGYRNAVLIFGITLLTVTSAYFLYAFLPENGMERFLLILAPYIFPFYLLQWLAVSLVTSYAYIISALFFGGRFFVSVSSYLLVSALVTALCLRLTLSHGGAMAKWVLRRSDYTRWK